jgi:hypothetical protein
VKRVKELARSESGSPQDDNLQAKDSWQMRR